MTRFYNPYQFIPVGKPDEHKLKSFEDIREGRVSHVRHDRWEEDACSGRIVCRLQTISPLVIGARQEETEEGKDGPKLVIPYRDGQALPANSLRGMIASVVESISNSAMRVLSKRDAHEYSVRKEMRDSLKAIGLLRKDDEGWYITPLALSALRLQNNHLPRKWQRVFSGLKLSECLAHYVGYYQNGHDDLTQELRNGTLTTYQYSDNREIKEYPHASAIADDVLVNSNLNHQRGVTIRQHTLKPRHLTSQGRTEGVYYVLGGRGNSRNMPRKKHELFIPWPSNIGERKRLSVEESLVSTFNTMLVKRHADSKKEMPFMPIGYDGRFRGGNPQIVKHGDLIYFDVDGHDDRVTELSYSAIWRKSVGNLYGSLEAIDHNLLPWNSGRKNLTPAEALFGVIEKGADGGNMENSAHNLASRLRFHDAEVETPFDLADDEILLKILASPKPPSPSMYFRTAGGGYISKQDLELPDPRQASDSSDDSNSAHDSDHIPNGRKRYLPHPDWQKNINGKNKWESQHPDDNRNQKLLCRPIPDGTGYWFHIDFENLSADELDLLRRAITPAPGFQHQLGLGKPLGLGQVKVEEMGVFLIDRKHRYGFRGVKADRYGDDSWWREDTAPEGHKPGQQAGGEAESLLSPQNNPLVDETALTVLIQLGTPDEYMDPNLPVCYPFDVSSGQKEYEEGEGFKWFVTNEKVRHPDLQQCLGEPVAEEKLPELESLHGLKLDLAIAGNGNRRLQANAIKRELAHNLNGCPCHVDCVNIDDEWISIIFREENEQQVRSRFPLDFEIQGRTIHISCP